MKYYKVLEGDGTGVFSGFKWNLPTKNSDGSWTPGEWMPEIEGELEFCKNGYHGCKVEDLVCWLDDRIYELEYEGEIIMTERKEVMGRKARLLREIETWNKKTARLFVCWCISQVWHLLTDERSRNAVEVAVRYANGEATDEELAESRAAAGEAWAAVRAAAGEAGREAQSAKLIEMLELEEQ